MRRSEPPGTLTPAQKMLHTAQKDRVSEALQIVHSNEDRGASSVVSFLGNAPRIMSI
jgi:hypothetical protein